MNVTTVEQMAVMMNLLVLLTSGDGAAGSGLELLGLILMLTQK